MKQFYRFSTMGLLCACLLVVLADQLSAQTLTPKYIPTSPNSNGFYEYLPVGYDPAGTKTYPLMIFVEGVGEHGNGTTQLYYVLNNGTANLINTGQFPNSFTVNGQTFSFIVLMPQFMQSPAETDIDGLIQYALSNYKVDANRVYLTGLSEGGEIAWAYPGYSVAFANKIAAILPVCGAIGINDSQAHNIAAGDVAVFATHNFDDPSVNYIFTVNNVKAVNSATPPPLIPAQDTIFPDPEGNGHNAWLVTYDPTIPVYESKLNVYQWMLQFSRGTTVPLPVSLISYTAEATAGGTAVNVDWTTGQEQNNHYFILQRSGDGIGFMDLDTIAAAAPPGGGHSYVYTDHAPLPGNNFYRLEQVDIDGKSTAYGILKVDLANQVVQDLRVSPNPSVGDIRLQLIDSALESITVSLVDLRGQQLRTWDFEKDALLWNQAIHLGRLPAGTYVLKIREKAATIVRTIVIE
jgi:hypothetical protein